MSRLLTALLAGGALLLPALSSGQNLEPPEKTKVSGRLMMEKEQGAPAGVAYFVFQRRLLEIPQENPLETLRSMAEAAVAVDEDGSFTIKMAPGNYALVYEPASQLDPKTLAPGDQSFGRQKQLDPAQIQERIKRIQENAQRGLPIDQGRIGEAHIVENRFVRPPVTDFGQVELGDPHVVTIRVNDMEGNAANFPVVLRMRGKSGDIYEPHPPTVDEPNKFVFHNLFPQSYQVFGLPTRPAPGQGDEATTPSVANADLLFTGEPLEWTVQVDPKPPAVELKVPEAPTEAPAAREEDGREELPAEESAVPRRR